jgi:hypothetical protein
MQFVKDIACAKNSKHAFYLRLFADESENFIPLGMGRKIDFF